MFHVVSTIRENVHQRILIGVVEDNQLESKTDPTIVFCQSFDTEANAVTYMKQLASENQKEYTKLLNLEGIPEDLGITNRYVYAYLGDDITPYPGIHVVHLHDVFKIKATFTQTRLATNEELDSLRNDQIKERIRVYDSIENDVLENLGTIITNFMTEDSTDQDNQMYHDLEDEMRMMSVNYNVKGVDKYAKISSIKSAFPDVSDDAISVYVEMMDKMKETIQKLKDIGMSDNEIYNKLIAGIPDV